MKKLLIISATVILIILLIPIIFIICEFFDDQLFCLEMGHCKEGLEINTEYGLTVINKENCLKCKGQWDEKNRYCNMR